MAIHREEATKCDWCGPEGDPAKFRVSYTTAP
jgi:hypothetical protein